MMKNIVNSTIVSALLLGGLIGCSNSTSSGLEIAPLDEAKAKTTKFAQDLLAGKDTTASQFTKDMSYDSSQTPILVNSKGDIAAGGTLRYFDADNHLVELIATNENELTIRIDFNDDGLFSEEERFIAIDPSEIGFPIDADPMGPIDVFEDYVPLSDWLEAHSAMDTTDVYIVLPLTLVSPVTSGEISTVMVQIDTEATKKLVLDFITENGLTRNESIEIALESGIEPVFQINLTKEKIESLLSKYDENELWIELKNSVIVAE